MNPLLRCSPLFVRLIGAALVTAATVMPLSAQAVGALTGSVVNSSTGAPIAAVRVSLVGTDISVRTDSSGVYQVFGVAPGTVDIRFDKPGFVAILERMPVGDGQVTVADFAMIPTVTMLDELSVTGTAASRGAAGRIERVDQRTIEQSGATGVSDLLSGRVAGAEVVWSDGQVGAGASVVLRGLTSVTRGNEPLVYVDGVRITNESRGGGLMPVSSALDFIDPSLIERIEVLKGPEAAQYGTGGANGVLLIYTKKRRNE